MEHYDVMVIGGGPAGYSSAIEASKKGLKVVLFEKRKMGGTCLNVGCIPTKFLLDKSSVISKIRGLIDLEILQNSGQFSFNAMQNEKGKVVEKLSKGVEFLLKKNSVTVVFEEVKVESKNKIVSATNEYFGEHLIIATGAEPIYPSFPGSKYGITSTEILSLTKLPKSLVVIGGGVIGLEFASFFSTLGSKVTILELAPEILAREELTPRKFLEDALIKKGIVIHTGVSISQISEEDGSKVVHYSQNGNRHLITCDTVLMATGRKANVSFINTESMDIKLTERGEIQVDKYMQTSVKDVYAVGDVAGGAQLAHVAYAEANVAVNHIVRGEYHHLERNVPRCIYTSPSYAAVGLTETEARQLGYSPKLGSLKYDSLGMGVAIGASGIVTIVMDEKTRTTLGVHIVGEQAHELIALATLAVTKKLSIDEWEDLVIAHPSLSEAVREAALDAFGRSVHKI